MRGPRKTTTSWVDVRVMTADMWRALQALIYSFKQVTFSVDFDPPASGPEVEISVQGKTEDEITAVLEPIFILAIRSRGVGT